MEKADQDFNRLMSFDISPDLHRKGEETDNRLAEYNFTDNFITKSDEINFFLRESILLESQHCEYYYIIPFKWLLKWDTHMADKSEAPPSIDNTDLINEDYIIKPNLVENVDFGIVTKSVAYYFHDRYGGDRRLKSKYRHVYSGCSMNNCEKHNLKDLLEVFKRYNQLLKSYNTEDDEEKKPECNLFTFTWC